MCCLSTKVYIKVRFSEVDSIKMVWHGHYVKYLEDAREEFGRQFGLSYAGYIENEVLAPMVDMHISYKSVARIDDLLCVEIVYHKCRGSKLMFDYIITRPSDGSLIATASTTQLFTDLKGNLLLSAPDFFCRWKEEHGIKGTSKKYFADNV